MSTFPYNEIAELLIEDSVAVSRDQPGDPEQRADAIMEVLSLTRLREYLLLHLTIDPEGWAVEAEQRHV
jgi:hypothetical protein